MEEQDQAYEADLQRNPYSLKNWLYYLAFKSDAAPSVRYEIYERALQQLPRSYKMWVKYLSERVSECETYNINDPRYGATNNTFENAIVHMNKFPVVWKMYLDFFVKQKFTTSTRRLFDRALRSLSVTQHTKWIWPGYLAFVNECGVPETAMRVWRRYIKINPNEKEEYIQSLMRAGRVDEAAVQLSEVISDEEFQSQRGRSKHDLWTDLLKLLVRNPQQIRSSNVDAVIRSGIRRYPQEVARLWNALADYYIRLGMMERARDVYAEAVEAVLTVRDFSAVYQAYTKFEEVMIEAKVKEIDQLEAAANGDAAAAAELAASAGPEVPVPTPEAAAELLDDANMDLELRMARLERLVATQPLLANSVLLRQNPHNVDEWQKRVKLVEGDPLRTVQTYSQAVTTIDPGKAQGKLHSLWARFAGFYEHQGQLDDARVIFERATEVEYKTVDALSHVYCRWAEMELLHGDPARALAVAHRATLPPKNYRSHRVMGAAFNSLPVAARLYKNTRVWALLADLEENFGTLETTRAAYERMLELRVVSPQVLLNYAALLEEHSHFEDAFRVYEKGVAAFEYPHAAPIWLAYLRKFVARYGGRKLERTREIFQNAVDHVPPKHARKLYLLYAKFEEQHGLSGEMARVYDRACGVVPAEEKTDLFLIYIAKVAEIFGATKTRAVFERAMLEVPVGDMPIFALRYAAMERRVGDIDRARAIFMQSSQYCAPDAHARFWTAWQEFETAHGNVDTYKDMLKSKRAVKAHFAQSSLVNEALLQEVKAKKEAAEAAAAAGSVLVLGKDGSAHGSGSAAEGAGDGAIAQLKRRRDEEQAAARAEAMDEARAEREARADVAEQAGVEAAQRQAEAADAQRRAAANPEEISLDEDNGDSMLKPLPSTLFGGASVK